MRRSLVHFLGAGGPWHIKVVLAMLACFHSSDVFYFFFDSAYAGRGKGESSLLGVLPAALLGGMADNCPPPPMLDFLSGRVIVQWSRSSLTNGACLVLGR